MKGYPHSRLLALLLLILSGCQGTVNLRQGNLVKTELYFGMNIPGGGTVTEIDWAQYLAEEVTPRFQDGLTVFSARGQWLGEDKAIAKESSRVVVLVYAYSQKRDADIQALIQAYKSRFRQEAVMRLDSRVRLGFY